MTDQLKSINVSTLKETAGFAQQFADGLEPGDILCLNGEIGTGKTTFVRLVCESLGITDDSVVKSPSFNIVHTYETKLSIIHHFDLYRLNSIEQLVEEVGLYDYLALNGIIFIEWAYNLGSLPIKDYYSMEFSYGKNETSRIIKLHAHGNHNLKKKWRT